MTTIIQTTTSTADTATASTAKPKGDRWQHKELEAVLKNPAITRVTEAGGLYGVVRRTKDGTPSALFRWRFRHAGKLCDFTAGTWPGDSLKDIRDAHEWAQDQHKQGLNPTASRAIAKTEATHAQAEKVRVHEEETVRALALKWQALELKKREGNPTTHVCVKSISKQVKDRQRTEPMKNRSKATATLLLSGGEWTPHDLRRTAATIMGERGVPGDIIERALNHTLDKLTRTYQKSDRWPELQDAWNRLGEHLQWVLTGKKSNVIALPTSKAA